MLPVANFLLQGCTSHCASQLQLLSLLELPSALCDYLLQQLTTLTATATAYSHFNSYLNRTLLKQLRTAYSHYLMQLLNYELRQQTTGVACWSRAGRPRSVRAC
jgi:hypothetical protein